MTLAITGRRSLHTIRGIQRNYRKGLAPGWVDTPDQVWWRGNDVARGTTVTVTGSQTLTEAATPTPQLTVTALSSISSGDMNCVLFPATITTTQKWRCPIRLQQDTGNFFLMGCVLVTDGVTSGATAAVSVNYHNTTGSNYISQGFGGTLSTLSGNTSAAAWTAGPDDLPSVWLVELEYVSANTFSQRVYDRSGQHLCYEQTGWSQTITPTHVGVGWSVWGEGPVNPVVEFGPLYRAA